MIFAKNLVKRFDEKEALKNISLQIAEGSVYGLVGSNGSGKSTLLRLISGVYMADEGNVGIDGENTFNNPALKSQIAFLGDTPYFLPQSDLKEMAALYSNMYPSFDYEIYNHLLTIFPLDQNARLSTFSKGMQRQAALILSLSTKPKYILLDEAFDGLDVVMRRVLANIIMESVEKYGMTAVIASHNLLELENVCDHIAVVHEGKIISKGDVDGIKGNIHKIQAAFSNVPELSVFDELDVMKLERTGSLISLIVRGDEEKIMQFINRLSPIYCEAIEPTLEEVFVYELEVIGYDVKNILS
ncbi:MAG: ABC transporter ATP-binding protein [Acutalibacteraceae bacterium]|nr:ABC transporter ATP-binding protein [Acutalibacteraceae bacterium]